MNSNERVSFHDKAERFLTWRVNITFWTRSYEVRLTALTWISYSWQTTCFMDYTGSRCCGFRGALSSTSVCDSVNR